MKKMIFIFLLLGTVSGFCQEINIDVVKSKIFKDDRKRTLLLAATEDNNGGLVTVRAYFKGLIPRIKGFYIEHFDKELNLLKKANITSNIQYISEVLIDEDKIYLIASKSNKRNKNEVDIIKLSSTLNSLDFKEDDTPLFSVNLKDLDKESLLNRIGNTGGILGLRDVIISKKKNFIALNFDLLKKNKEVHRILVFNNKFEKH